MKRLLVCAAMALLLPGCGGDDAEPAPGGDASVLTPEEQQAAPEVVFDESQIVGSTSS